LNESQAEMSKYETSNIGRMPELTEFGMIYSAVGKILVLDLAMKDSLTGYIDDPPSFPDLEINKHADLT